MTGEFASTELYVEVLQFYSAQMRALDNGKFAEFADTFTPDGEFTHTVGRQPARTTAGIIAELEDFHRTSVGADVQRRHWFTMQLVNQLDDDVIETSVYALVMRILPGGRPEVTFSGLANDILVRQEGALRTRSRTVVSDAAR
jgi:actinorhodin biosynthesis protein ActVIA